MAGQIGFDEGGVLEALSKPFYTRKWVEKRGKREIEHIMNISAAHVLFLLVLRFGPEALAWFKVGGSEALETFWDWLNDMLPFGDDDPKKMAQQLKLCGQLEQKYKAGEITTAQYNLGRSILNCK